MKQIVISLIYRFVGIEFRILCLVNVVVYAIDLLFQIHNDNFFKSLSTKKIVLNITINKNAELTDWL